MTTYWLLAPNDSYDRVPLALPTLRVVRAWEPAGHGVMECHVEVPDRATWDRLDPLWGWLYWGPNTSPNLHHQGT